MKNRERGPEMEIVERQQRLIDSLKKNDLMDTLDLLEGGKNDEILESREVQVAAKREMVESLKVNKIEKATQIADLFRIDEEVRSSPEIQAAAKETILRVLKKGSILGAQRMVAAFRLEEGFFQATEEVRDAAMAGLVVNLKMGRLDLASYIIETLGFSDDDLSSPEVKAAAADGVVEAKRRGWEKVADELAARFKL